MNMINNKQNDKSNEPDNDYDLEQEELENQTAKSIETTLYDLVLQLENLGSEKEKDEFIKNYGRLKEQIELTDLALSDSPESEKFIKKYENMSVGKLFELMEKNSEFIANPKNLSIWRFKQLLIISKVLEQKLDANTLDIVETK